VIDIRKSLDDETFLPHDDPDEVLGNTGKAGVYLTVRYCGK